jgi:[acyl-carrier-protein] S-malonyltransferase
VAAGALSFQDAVRTVNARGRFMQEAVSADKGAMAAVLGCTPEQVIEACDHARLSMGGVVEPANFNSPQQTVIAGEAAAVEAACSRAKELGAKRTVPLPVSAPFHCSLMQPAADKLELELSRVRFADANPPVVTNVEASPNSSASRTPALLKEQVTAPVRFTDMVATLREQGVNRFLEVGPGRVLFGLLARIDRRAARASCGAASDLEECRAFALGE